MIVYSIALVFNLSPPAVAYRRIYPEETRSSIVPPVVCRIGQNLLPNTIRLPVGVDRFTQA